MLSFSHEMHWMKSGTELSQFQRVFIPSHTYFEKNPLKTSYPIMQ